MLIEARAQSKSQRPLKREEIEEGMEVKWLLSHSLILDYTIVFIGVVIKCHTSLGSNWVTIQLEDANGNTQIRDVPLKELEAIVEPEEWSEN